MNRLIQFLALCGLAASMSGCASTSGYFTDRARDAADILTVSGGYGVGAKARVSCLNFAPCLFEKEVVGLRGGGLFLQRHSDSNDVIEASILCFAGETFIIHGSPQKERDKTFGMGYFMMIPIPILEPEPSMAYFTQIEIVAALGPAVRLGFNPGELLDFLLGWFGKDIFNDDLGARRQREKSNQMPEDTARSLADPQQ